MYIPDKWVIVKITEPGEFTYKVFAGWLEGYTTAPSWKLNSGIVNVTMDGDYFMFEGYSGSIYRCHKNQYGMSSYMMDIYKSLEKLVEGNHHNLTIDVLAEDVIHNYKKLWELFIHKPEK